MFDCWLFLILLQRLYAVLEMEKKRQRDGFSTKKSKFIIFSPVALQSLKDLGRLTYRRFLELFRHMVGLLGRVISPSQNLYLHRTTEKDADKHACLERDSNPRSQQPTG
jgi:hypothetical protein